MVVPSFERIVSTSPPLQSTDILGYVGQIVVELVPAAVELPDGRPRQLLGVQRGVRERHHLVVAAVVQEHRYLFGDLRREVFSQRILVDLPIFDAPVGRRDEEQPRDGLLYFLLGEVPQQYRTAQGVADENHLPLQRVEFLCNSLFPRLVHGAIFAWHLRIPHVVRGAQRILQGDAASFLSSSYAPSPPP